ncbi:complement C1q domain-containing protein [Planctomycetota bacterium]|nr:complement C1q domain-containing protein [Planctomycetota bacterium]
MSKLYVNEVHSKTGATKALEIDSSGNITASGNIITPTRPVFSATSYSANGNLFGNGTISNLVTGIQWANVEVNQGSHFDNTTGIFTCPVDGIYSVFFNLNYKATAGTFMGAQVCLNGDLKAQSWSGTTDSYNNAVINIFLDCSSNDEIGCGYRNDYQTPSSLAYYNSLAISLI